MRRSKANKEVMGKRLAVLIAMVALFLSLGPSIARADVTEDENGFYLGLALAGSSYHIDWDFPPLEIKEDGGGAQLSVGYRFNPVFMLEIAAGGSMHETSDTAIDAGVVSVQLMGYYRFLPGKSFRPYLKGGFAGNSLTLKTESASARITGGGIAFGTGFKCFLSRRFSLGLDLTHTMIRYDKAKLSVGQLSYESNADESGRLTTVGITAGYSF